MKSIKNFTVFLMTTFLLSSCAIIKIVTTQKGFVFEGGSLGIVNIQEKTGEIWIYVPHGAIRITIKHDKFGIHRNYAFPVPIDAAAVYEMVHITPTVTTIDP